MNLKNILSKFGEDIGTGPVTLDQSNSCYLRFGLHTIILEHMIEQGRIFVYTGFQKPSDLPQEQYFESILKANHFCQGSGNAWFSFNPDTQEFLLMTYLLEDRLDYDYFVLTLEQFLFSTERALEFLNDQFQNQKFKPSIDLRMKNPFV